MKVRSLNRFTDDDIVNVQYHLRGEWPSGHSFGRDVKLWVPCLDAACIEGLKQLNKLRLAAYSKYRKQQQQQLLCRRKVDIYAIYIY